MKGQGIDGVAQSVGNAKRGAINAYFIAAQMLDIGSSIHIRSTVDTALTSEALDFTIGNGVNSNAFSLKGYILNVQIEFILNSSPVSRHTHIEDGHSSLVNRCIRIGGCLSVGLHIATGH